MDSLEEQVADLRRQVAALKSRETNLMAITVYTYLTLRQFSVTTVGPDKIESYKKYLDQAGQFVDEYIEGIVNE